MPSDSTDLFGDPVPVPSRRCSRCKQIKPNNCFGMIRPRHGRSYRKRWCRECERLWHRDHNKKPHRQRQRHISAIARRGLTLEDYDAMLAAQNGVCAICSRPESIQLRTIRGHRQLSIDHSHVTGAVRGLLCRACNTGIAQFDDNPVFLLAAIEYLNQHSNSS